VQDVVSVDISKLQSNYSEKSDQALDCISPVNHHDQPYQVDIIAAEGSLAELNE